MVEITRKKTVFQRVGIVIGLKVIEQKKNSEIGLRESMIFKSVLSKIDALASSHLDFIKKAFSDNGTPSSSRLLTIPHTITACVAVLYIVFKTHTIDGMTASGLGAFAGAHYAINRVTTAFGKNQNPAPTPDDAAPSADAATDAATDLKK